MFYSIDSQGWKLLEETDGSFVFGAKETYKIAPRKQFVVFDFNLPPNKSVLIRPSKKNVCLRKSGWPKKSPPGRQGIYFFS